MTGPVQGVAAVPALLLRAALPELELHEGASFVARVASLGDGGRASLVVAGRLISALLPEPQEGRTPFKDGQTLRLTVAEVTPERVTLRLETSAVPPAAVPAVPPAPPEAPWRIAVDERPARGEGRAAGEAAVSLTVQTPALGTLRLRVATAPGGVSATVQVPAAALEAARARAGRLREDLAAQTGRPAAVRVVRGSVDVRA